MRFERVGLASASAIGGAIMLFACLAAMSGCATPETIEGQNWAGSPATPLSETYTPQQAMRKDVDGWVMLRCVAGPEHRATGCVVIAEFPLGMGFGDAAMRMTDNIRAADASSFAELGARVPVVGERFDMPLVFCEANHPSCAAQKHREVIAFKMQEVPVERLVGARRCAEAIAAADQIGQPAFVRFIASRCAT